jgi:hypothetical protein
MDADRFDALTQFIGSRTSRRVVVGLAATGLLSMAVPDAEAARCSKQKPCPECKKCKRHRCKPDATQNGTVCSGGTGTCVKGTCCPLQLACGSTCCASGKQCSGGICVPACAGFGDSCNVDGDCCSVSCVSTLGSKFCTCSPAGKVCHSSSDCCGGLGCVGFFCQ